MCGIAGIFNIGGEKRTSEQTLRSMLGVIAHRGPDESGVYISDRIGIGHVRLRIIDISGGIQPLANEEGNLWIVYNGEVFNFPELRQELRCKGHRFGTNTDTEVVLHLYQQEGLGCFQRLNGQFALAIWDTKRQELVLARDRLGIRPLYFARTSEEFVFASEVKGVLAHPGISRELDPKSLAQIFTFWAPLAAKTAFRQVHSVLPGQVLRIQAGKEIRTDRYWQLPMPGEMECPFASITEAGEVVKALLQDAVRIRLRADVRVGSYLSGGLDSSLIAALAASATPDRLATFSIGFAAGRFDESTHQTTMSRHLRTVHKGLHIANADILRALAQAVWHCETPLLRTAPVPLYLLSGLVREQGYRVVLTGEGADEVFLGYDIFKEAKIREFWGRQPESRTRPLLLERLYPYVFSGSKRVGSFLRHFYTVNGRDFREPFFSHQVRWDNCRRNLGFFSQEILGELDGYAPLRDLQAGLPPGFADMGTVQKAQYLEMEIFLKNYLLSSQGDRVAMANAVEIRLPFLDHRVVRLAASLPDHWKLRGLQEKYILKKLSSGLVPASVSTRPKQPYRAPIGELFQQRDMWPEAVQEALSAKRLHTAGVFNPRKVAKLLAKYVHNPGYAGSEVQDMALMGILSTQLLHGQFVLGGGYTGSEAFVPTRRITDRA